MLKGYLNDVRSHRVPQLLDLLDLFGKENKSRGSVDEGRGGVLLGCGGNWVQFPRLFIVPVP